MDKIELLRKGREKYEMLVVTRHVRGEEHFIGVFSSYEEMQKRVNPFISHGIIFVWQMNAGDQLGEGIFDNDDMAASGCDYIVSEDGKRVER